MKHDNGITPRAIAIAAVPEQQRAALLAKAADLGIQSPQDAVWILLAMTLAAREQVDTVAGQVQGLREVLGDGLVASQQHNDQFRKVAESASNQAAQHIIAAGDKAASVTGKAITDALVKAQGTLADTVKGAGDQTVRNLAKTADSMKADFERAIQQERSAIVQRFSDAGTAAVKDAVASDRLHNFWSVALILLFCVFSGAGVLYIWLENAALVAPEPLLLTRHGHFVCNTYDLKRGGETYMCEMQSPPPSDSVELAGP